MDVIIEAYVKEKIGKKVLTIAEDQKTLFLMVFSEEEEEELEYVDVYLVNPATNKFEMLPREIATPIADSYIEYMTAIAGGYIHFDTKGTNKENNQ